MPISSEGARRLTWLFVALVVAKAAAYWVGSLLLRPDDPFSTIVLYRGKDIESFPIMKILGNLGFGEAGVFERYNQGVLTERFVPWVLHAILFRTLGPSGFVVADLLVTPVYFLLLRAVLKACGISRVVATAVAAVITCAAISDFGDLLAQFGVFPRFWGLRLPRPFISELFLLTAVLGMVAAKRGLLEQRVPRWAWIAAGAGLGLLMQSDLYSAIALGLGAVGVLARTALSSERADRTTLGRGILEAAAAGALVSLPGVIQSMFVNPEAIVRLGLFEVSRLRPPFIDTPSWYVWTALVAAAGVLLGRLTRGRSQASADIDIPAQRAGRAVVLAASLGSLLAMPFTSIVTGTAIELYHYRDTFVRMLSLAGLVVVLQGVPVFWSLVAARHPGLRDRMTSATAMVTIVLAVVACVGLGIRHAVTGPARSDHMRSDFQEWAELRNYRSQFVELVRELERPEYGGGRVLGTFDHQVWAWWVTFRGGYSYLGDACTTNVGDTELERRVGELSSFLRMTRAEYEVFIRRRYIMIFWMSCSKYQATRTYSFAPRSDYSPADQRLIETAPPYLGFTVALPLSQLERLGSEFSSLPPRPSSRLDVVVLTKDTSTTRMEPPADEFELTFENRLFRVWSRKPAA